MRISESSGYKPSLPDQASVTKLFFPSLTSHLIVTRRNAWTGSVSVPPRVLVQVVTLGLPGSLSQDVPMCRGSDARFEPTRTEIIQN